MHHLRESIAGECVEFHQQIWTTLRASGVILHEPVPDDSTTTKHACPECRMLFPTSTGLAVHREKKHGIRCPIKGLCPERDLSRFVSSTCGHPNGLFNTFGIAPTGAWIVLWPACNRKDTARLGTSGTPRQGQEASCLTKASWPTSSSTS